MYTVSSGYMYQQSVSKQKERLHKQRQRTARVILMLIMIGLSFLFGAMVSVYATDEKSDAAATETQFSSIVYVPYSVERGETLWAIAKQYLPENMDIRSFIHDIKMMNQLKSSMLQEGQLLQIPVSLAQSE